MKAATQWRWWDKWFSRQAIGEEPFEPPHWLWKTQPRNDIVVERLHRTKHHAEHVPPTQTRRADQWDPNRGRSNQGDDHRQARYHQGRHPTTRSSRSQLRKAKRHENHILQGICNKANTTTIPKSSRRVCQKTDRPGNHHRTDSVVLSRILHPET